MTSNNECPLILTDFNPQPEEAATGWTIADGCAPIARRHNSRFAEWPSNLADTDSALTHMPDSEEVVFYAHTPNEAGAWHGLEDHLRSTARRAEMFARAIGPEAAALAYHAGLWHDVGKFGSSFQRYLRDQARGVGTTGSGGDHKGAGAVQVLPVCDWLAFVIAGHHGGLPSAAGLKGKLDTWRQPVPHVADALSTARLHAPDLLTSPGRLPLPDVFGTEWQVEFFLRMLFSCLVDADFLDTEAHFDRGRGMARTLMALELESLWRQFSVNQEALIARSRDAQTAVNEVREQVYRAALEAAKLPPGYFRLTVPTGGGKTRTGLGFGLRHALEHGLRRIIVAVPYTSITEQTAQSYRAVFGDESGVVLEHHSAVTPDGSEHPTPEEIWRRLASENWDAPIIVTTTVQLFESLLGAATSACRKLHNIVGSIVILDEAQTLPPRLLTPLLDVLRELVAHYRVSVVFCTATQPAFEAVPGFGEVAGAREIAPEPPALFRKLQRVNYRWPTPGEEMAWSDVAEHMRHAPQALCIVNTKKDALALLTALEDPTALHLSTLLCGAHRRLVLDTVRERLRAGEPCRLVSTQVVEAGVDLDFPLVFRALGPLDSIVQAAGRCNREGKLERGEVVVFEPMEGGLPPNTYRVATESARTVLAAGEPDVDDPTTFARFFRLFYQVVDTDRERVQACRRARNYPETAARSRLIDDDQLPVVVRYRGPDEADDTVDRLLARLRGAPQAARSTLRALQPFVVNVRRREAQQFKTGGLMEEVMPGLDVWVWRGEYHQILGLQSRIDPDRLVF